MKTPASYKAVKVDSYHPPPVAQYPRGNVARILCIIVLIISWIAGIASIIYGLIEREPAYWSQWVGWISIPLSVRLQEVVPLLLNVGITLIEVGLGLVHTTALRWALGDRLIFNSNLRLFTIAPDYWCLGRLSNFLWAGLMTLTYCSASFVFSELPTVDACAHLNVGGINETCGDSDAAFISPQAIIALGVGILGQAMLAAWQLFAVKIPTWSTSPINTAWALTAERHRLQRPGRAMMGVRQNQEPARPELPVDLQPRAFALHKEIRRVVIYLWVVFSLALVWFGIVYGLTGYFSSPAGRDEYGYGVFVGSDWSFLPDSAGTTSILQVDTVDSQDQGLVGEDPRYDGSIFSLVDSGVAVSLLFVMVIQSFITMGLHTAELIVNASRDEDTWRSFATEKGYKDRNVIVSVLSSWKALVLLAAKPFLHWMFGLAMKFYFAWGIFLRPPQILYLAIALLVFAIFPTALSLRQPKGPQPATYGHLQTLIDLIDAYDTKLWWGDKTAAGFGRACDVYTDTVATADPHVRHAGTWGEHLPSVITNGKIFYA